MIFKETHHLIPKHEWQTRRPVKPGEWARNDKGLFAYPGEIIEAVYDQSGRLKWKVGKDYAIQPGRGKKSIGRTPPIEAIRRERLQEISCLDCRVEMGISSDDPKRFAIYLLPRFIDLWNSLYRKPYRWEDTPEVWVLEFEKEEENGEVVRK